MKHRPDCAFSLAEVIVTLAIASIALLGLLRLQLTSMAASEKANALTQAMLLAQSKIAETETSSLPSLGTSYGTVRAGNLRLQWQRSVTQSGLSSLEQAVNSGLHRVAVDVSWQHGLGKKNVKMVTYVADRALP